MYTQRNNKILLFIKVPPPITGATLMNKRVNDSELLRKYFHITSICISYSNDVSEIGKYKLNKLYKFILVFLRLVKELLFNRPAVVYFQISPFRQGFYRDLFFVMLIKIFRIKILFHLRGKGIRSAAKKKWKKFLYKYAFHGSDVICLSYLLTYDVENVFSGKVFIVNNGIPDIENRYKKNDDIFLKSDAKIKILFLSNLIKSKGILDFLQAASILKSQRISFQGIIIGAEGDLSEHELSEEIQNRALCDCMTYLGKKYGTEKYNILKQTDLIVFPTKNDAFPAIPIEAMQFSIPIISTYEGAIPDIVDNLVTGFLVEKSCPNKIAQKIKILINDIGFREKMGRAARRKYERKYTLQHFENNMKSVFEEVLNDINRKF